MTIGIVLHPYNEQKPAGLGRSILELTRAMVAYAPEHEYVVYVRGDASVPELAHARGSFRVVSLGCWSIVSGIGFWFAEKSDVYIFNTPVLPVLFWPKRTVVIVHDFAYKYFPDHTTIGAVRSFVMGLYHRMSLYRATAIVAVSKKTQSDAVEFFGAQKEKTHVIYWGFKSVCAVPPVSREVPENFFLSVGVLKERKNTLGIIKAFERALLPKHSLVIVGAGGGAYAQRIRRYVRERSLEGLVVFLDYISDAELSFLYQHARALVYPSFIEGFGFPVLEAFDCGTPVITSRGTSLAEVAGDAALVVDPKNVDEISQALVRVAGNESFRQSLIARGRERANAFSWQKTAAQYTGLIALLKKIV